MSVVYIELGTVALILLPLVLSRLAHWMGWSNL